MKKAQASKPAPRAATWADYGVKIDEWTFAGPNGEPNARDEDVVVCEKCNQYRLRINRIKMTGHCEGCYFSFKVHGTQGQGIVDLEDYEPILERWRTQGLPPKMAAGIGMLDELYQPRRGEVTVLTGFPGDGKSTWLKWYLLRVALLQRLRFAVFSPEDMPYHLYLGQLAVKIVGKPFKEIEQRELRLATAFARGHFVMLDPPLCSAEGLMAQLREAAKQGIQGAVIDPWTEVEHDIPYGMREDQYLNSKLTQFRRLARFLHIHLWIVVHPKSVEKIGNRTGTKALPVPTLDDCAGGAMWRNKTDWGLTVHRPNKGQDQDYVVDLHIQKGRFSGFLGGGLGVERLEYLTQSGSYRDCAKAEQTLYPLEEYKAELNTRSLYKGYFDKPDWTWPPRDGTILRPIAWSGRPEGGYRHESGKFEAFVDATAEGWLSTVRLKADVTSRRAAGPFAKTDDAFGWAEKLLMDWDYLPDPIED